MSDELIELHAAYGNAQKEISDLKSHNDILIKSNKELYKEKNIIHDRLVEVEEVRQDYFKQIKRLERRSGKLGKDLLKCKNELRNPAPHKDDWKQFNKANRQGKWYA